MDIVSEGGPVLLCFLERVLLPDCSLVKPLVWIPSPDHWSAPRDRVKPSAAWFHRISDPGPGDSSRWNICICPSPSPQLASPCFSVFMGTNDQSFPPWIRKCPTGEPWFKLELPSLCRQLLCYIGHPKSRLSSSQPSWLKGVALI